MNQGLKDTLGPLAKEVTLDHKVKLVQQDLVDQVANLDQEDHKE